MTLTITNRLYSSRNSNQSVHLGDFYLQSPCQAYELAPLTKVLFQAWINFEYSYLINKLNITAINTYDENKLADSQYGLISQFTRKKVYVFAGGSKSPFLSDFHNRSFRLIHDYHHFLTKHHQPFSIAGETQAYKIAQDSLVSFGKRLGYAKVNINQAVSVLYSEIILQAHAYHANGCKFPATQKVVLIPQG